MVFNTAEKVLGALVHAYYDERDVEVTLSCVTEDIEWVGTENNDIANGKTALRELLEADVAAFSESFSIELDEPIVQSINDDAVLITVTGKQVEVPGIVAGFEIRGTVCIVNTEQGWLVKNVHTSVPNSEMEKINLKRELDENRRIERTLLASIPGGVAIYRLKKDGIVHTDYVSDSLGKMCDYASGEEFKAYLSENALVNLVPEDIPMVQSAMQKSMETHQPISVTYRIHSKQGQVILQRLDASLIEGSLSNDDIAMWYAVHTFVSEETKQKLEDLKQLSELVNQVPCGIGIYEIQNGKFNLSYLNDAYYTELGTTRKEREQFLGNHALLAVHIDDHKAIMKLIEKLQSGSDTGEALIRVANAENKWIWFTITASVVEREGDYLKAYLAYSNCHEMICAQQEKEEKYEEQLRLRKLSNKNIVSVGTFNLSRNYVMESESDDLVIKQALTDFGIDEMLQNIWKEINIDSNFPKSRMEMLERYVKGETQFSVRYCMKHGYRWMESSFELITNPYNGDVEATGVMRDVSETVRAELVVSKLLKIDYDAISTINIGTGIATPFSISADETGMDEMLQVQETHQDNMAVGLEEFFRTYCTPEDVERTIHENSMSYILEHLKMQPFIETIYSVNFGKGIEHKRAIYTYLDESKLHLLCAVQNFTATYEKEKAQKAVLAEALDKANAANKAKTDFLSRVSHDMRTPLNGILGLTALLKDSITDTDTLKDLTELEMSGKYLLDLINDTLDMSRIESGNLELHPVVFDGRTMFNNAIRMGELSIKGRNIKFNVNVENIPFTLLYVDVSRFEQVVMNVFGNAAKFTPDGGEITLTMTNLSIENGVITDKLVIADTGIGMSAEFLPHIFNAFSQEDSSNTSRTQGTGLGMAITKQLLQHMGGDITVESELGKGSTFTMILKFNMATDEQIAEWEKTRNISTGSTDLVNKRVLLCEDHPLNTQIATRLLTAKGVEVEHAENGQIAVEMFKHSAPGFYDAVLMDIRMPVMDGLQATKAIRNLHHEDAHLIPIIAMTANAFSDDIEQTQKAGMNAHLSKPIQTEILYQTLAKQMNVSHERKKQLVLVVDDVEINRAVVAASLKPDYEIIEAETGKAALEILRKIKGIDAVITDIQMPEMDGVELIRQIRSDKKYRHVVIIANTQFGDPEQEEKLLALGANDFVYKPTTPKIVEIRVRNALKRI